MIRTGIAVAFAALVVRVAAGATNVCESTAYIAPVNQLIFRMVMPGGGVREFERNLLVPGELRGADGWRGRMNKAGIIEILSPDKKEYYRFDRGRLTAAKISGAEKKYSYETPRSAPEGAVSPLYITREDMREAAKNYSYNEFIHKWDGTGRLAFPFVNPNQNGALYAELLVLFAWVFALFRKRSVKFISGAFALISAGCLFWTMSRGAWLGVALASVPFVYDRAGKIVKSRKIWTASVLSVVAVGLWVVFFGAGQIVRGFESGGWTNAIRLEIWGNAPRMMFDAPSGWDFFHVGSAYLHWYQPLHVFALTPTLINDHLTWLAGWGWPGRFFYIAAVILVFAVSFVAWRKRGCGLALSLWIVLFVAAWFNPMLHRPLLWAIPVAASCFAVRYFLFGSVRHCLVLAASVFAVAGGITFVLYYAGNSAASKHTRIYADASSDRVAFGARNPVVWIVDDGMLGGGLAGKDIREFYSVEKSAPAIGYVRDIKSLPQQVHKLVLSGHAGADWLTMLSENPKARENLPGKVVFISPPFAPEDIPEGVRMTCDVKVLTGEFAALYDPGFHKKVPRVAVDVVPGMEQYVLQWMWRVMRY